MKVTPGRGGLGWDKRPHISAKIGVPLQALHCLQEVGISIVAGLHIHCHGVLWLGTPCRCGQDGIPPNCVLLLSDYRPEALCHDRSRRRVSLAGTLDPSQPAGTTVSSTS